MSITNTVLSAQILIMTSVCGKQNGVIWYTHYTAAVHVQSCPAHVPLQHVSCLQLATSKTEENRVLWLTKLRI
jgi:hypothetical protein